MCDLSYWKSDLSEIEKIIGSVKKGNIVKSKSAGNKNIYLVEYGKENNLKRKANYSSACGARDISCYADKSHSDYRPSVLIVGGIHGAECEGIMAALNLISYLENGIDLSGRHNDELLKQMREINLHIIPCANPDGRVRFPKQSAVGMGINEFRYYAQGTWKNGDLCNWPECKRVHPIKEASDYLGAYYNDDGINMMHDNFCIPMAEETNFLMKVVDRIVPDMTVLLHGCADAKSEILMPRAVHSYFKDKAYKFAKKFSEVCEENDLPITLSNPLYGKDEPIHSFNLVSALTSICGELCMVYESNQGLCESANAMSHNDIYRQHMLLFESMFSFVKENV